MSATCRIYLCTYRRPELLVRAIDSLIGQTFTDWVCELHNDAPDDPRPEELVGRIADPRITVVNHAENLGPTRTFNLMYQPVPERYVSLLEDDNWWEPQFLERMVAVMEESADVHVAWSNMRLWQEERDGSWTDTGDLTWRTNAGSTLERFEFPQLTQALGALHSHGAMLIRSDGIAHHVIPNETTSAAVELVRERTFHYPILLVSDPLANFARTIKTSRAGDPSEWMYVQVLMAASFFKNVTVHDESIPQIWKDARAAAARATNTLLLASMFARECRRLLGGSSTGDVFYLLRSFAIHPVMYLRLLFRLHCGRRLWAFLDSATRERMMEREAAQGRREVALAG